MQLFCKSEAFLCFCFGWSTENSQGFGRGGYLGRLVRWRLTSRGSGQISSGIGASGCSTLLRCCKDDDTCQTWTTLHLNCIRYQRFHRRFHLWIRSPSLRFTDSPSRLNFLWWSCPGLCRRLALPHRMHLCRIYALLTTILAICWPKVWRVCFNQDQMHHLWSKQKYDHVSDGFWPHSKVCLHSLPHPLFRIWRKQLQVDQKPLLLVSDSQ